MPRYKFPDVEVFDMVWEYLDAIEQLHPEALMQSVYAKFENASNENAVFPRVLKFSPQVAEIVEYIIEQLENELEVSDDRLGIEVLP